MASDPGGMGFPQLVHVVKESEGAFSICVHFGIARLFIVGLLYICCVVFGGFSGWVRFFLFNCIRRSQ